MGGGAEGRWVYTVWFTSVVAPTDKAGTCLPGDGWGIVLVGTSAYTPLYSTHCLLVFPFPTPLDTVVSPLAANTPHT